MTPPGALMRQNSDEFSSPVAGTPSSRPPDHLLASLVLGFGRNGPATRMIRREHVGPLLVQKPLYPEGVDCCHAVIIHPPGGVVGGDELKISAEVGDRAHALLSTPGAAKWYRSNGKVSRQRLEITVGKEAALEWLPQETILFNEADVVFDSHVELRPGARYLGCEILCFGRTASGEQFAQGRVRQSLRIHSDGKPIFIEQGTLLGNGAMMHNATGLSGHTVCASLICVGGPLGSTAPGSVREACAPFLSDGEKFGTTQMKSVLLVRYLGDSSEVARRVMLAAWCALRPSLLGRKSTELRIWNT
jgi:urease accessory protein